MPARRTRKTKLLERRRSGSRSIPEKDEAAFERPNVNDRGASSPESDGDTASVAPEPDALLSFGCGTPVWCAAVRTLTSVVQYWCTHNSSMRFAFETKGFALTDGKRRVQICAAAVDRGRGVFDSGLEVAGGNTAFSGAFRFLFFPRPRAGNSFRTGERGLSR